MRKIANMRLDWKIIATFVIILITFCAKPKAEWLKWQESLNLTYPDAMSFKIDIKDKSFYEGEPITFRMLIINEVDIPRTIIHLGSRTAMIRRALHTFKVVTGLDSVLRYSPYSHAHGSIRPEDAIVLGPYDTVYCHAILNSDLFSNTGYPSPKERTPLIPADYIIESKIHLGTKFYPKPGRALNLISHPMMFRIIALPAEEHECWAKIRPYLDSFFGFIERSFLPFSQNNDREAYVDSALFWLDIVRDSKSLFAPYADFVYTCIPAVTRGPYDGKAEVNKSIVYARTFIEKYMGSILAEEMEFKLTWWLYYKDSTSAEFHDQATEVIEKYPKNLNSYGIKKLLNRGP